MADETDPGRAPRRGRGRARAGPRAGGGARGRPARPTCRALAKAQETWFALSGLKERLRGTQSLAAERIRNAAGAADADTVDSGRDPDELEAQAARVREQEAEIAAQVEEHRAALEAAVGDSAYGRGRRGRGGAPHRRAGPRRRRPSRGTRPAARPGQRAEVAGGRGRRARSVASPSAREEALARAERAQTDFTVARDQGRRARRRRGGPRRGARGRRRGPRRHRRAPRQGPRGGPAGRSRPGRAGGPPRRARARPQPQGRRRCAARRHRHGVAGCWARWPRCSSVKPGYEAAVAAALGTAADAVVVTGCRCRRRGDRPPQGRRPRPRRAAARRRLRVDDAAWPRLPGTARRTPSTSSRRPTTSARAVARLLLQGRGGRRPDRRPSTSSPTCPT